MLLMFVWLQPCRVQPAAVSRLTCDQVPPLRIRSQLMEHKYLVNTRAKWRSCSWRQRLQTQARGHRRPADWKKWKLQKRRRGGGLTFRTALGSVLQSAYCHTAPEHVQQEPLKEIYEWKEIRCLFYCSYSFKNISCFLLFVFLFCCRFFFFLWINRERVSEPKEPHCRLYYLLKQNFFMMWEKGCVRHASVCQTMGC